MIPTSTYRVQISPGQDLRAARGLVDYLSSLGVGALYCSPLLAATPGSDHGYDVVDPTRTDPGRGGDEARAALVTALRAAGLGVVVDLVPNHMGVADPAANPSWWSLLREGRSSPYAAWYDVDWDAGPLLIPVLGAPEDVSQLEISDDGTELRYHEHRFPLADGTGRRTPQDAHARQHYRLVHWRRGNAELTYRRFFDVTDLAAVRVEDPEVFDATHAEVLRWRAAGELDGLRIDHPDGLTDPGGYLRRLRSHLGDEAWLLVEKILAPGEALPGSWPVDGTTGYEALRETGGLFVDPRGEALLDAVAARHTGHRTGLAVTEHTAKRLVTDEILVAEVRRIAALVDVSGVPPQTPGVSHGTPSPVDVDRVRDAVAELLVSFPVYRSYLPEGRDALDVAVDTAASARPDLADDVRRVHAAVLADPDGALARRLQQTSGMVTAKGVEDTTFYRWNRFVALNEVGGAPDRFGVTPAAFHAAAAARSAGSPATMTTLSTHDTKRAEDVRARLAVLAELPAAWGAFLASVSARHPLPSEHDGAGGSLDLLAWQSVLGAWPIGEDRLRDYLGKAAKEAKLVTAHVGAVPAVDEAIAAWPAQVLGDPATRAEIEALVARLDGPGHANALGQKLLQLAGPGVPDVYQGTECVDLSLVDPDNRRPVDFDRRRALLARLDEGWTPDPFGDADQRDASKLAVTAAALRLRRHRPDLFTGYRPLPAQGPAADHAVAFARGGPTGRERLVAVATRLPVGLAAADGWSDTVLPLPAGNKQESWTDVVTGRTVDSAAPRVADLLSSFPVALLVRPA